MFRLKFLQDRLRPFQSALFNHPLYRHMAGIHALRRFMEHHVFAVWDFMSLLKTLQRRFSCVDVPWLPASDSLFCRFVNEIVLAEESDEDSQGGFISHFELYHRAMTRSGADTSAIDAFVCELRGGRTVRDALESVSVPGPARFVRQTFAIIEEGDECAVASAFTFGREDVLPAIFRRMVDALDVEMGGDLADFRYYLNRHIGLDEGEHGPMANRLVALLCGNDEIRWQSAEHAAIQSLQARKELWDGVYSAIQSEHKLPVG